MGAAIVYLGACTDCRRRRSPRTSCSMRSARSRRRRRTPAPSAGHVCDGSGDILHRFAQYVPLSSLALDVNRDDYHGHGGSWLDVQTLPWLRRLDARSTATVVLTGTGPERRARHRRRGDVHDRLGSRHGGRARGSAAPRSPVRPLGRRSARARRRAAR
jgi:hypothetical protein